MTTYPTPKTRCKGCHYRITWAEIRRQYGRMLRRGLTEGEAKAAGPRCQKCMTRYLRERDTVADVLADDDIERHLLVSLKGETPHDWPQLEPTR